MNRGPDKDLVPLKGWFKNADTQAALEGCSLIVPTYQRPNDVLRLVHALAKLPDAPAEVVVVDGSPGTESEGLLRGWALNEALPFKFIYVRGLRGLTRQRNAGIDVSSGDPVFFLDDDCIPEPGYFSAISTVFTDDDEKRQIGGVCGTDLNLFAGPLRLPARWRIRFALGLVDGRDPRRFYPSGITVPRQLTPMFTGIQSVDYLTGAAMAFRRVVLEKQRFSAFFSGYSAGEDLEMSLRVGQDWALVWCGDARARHYGAPGGRPEAFQKAVMEVRNRYFIWRRHCPWPTLRARIQFWLDLLLLLACDLARLASPRGPVWHLKHAAGVVTGILKCLLNPPLYQEPIASREYFCELSDLADSRLKTRTLA